MGGDSGSLWMHFSNGRATGLMLGLHFAGEINDEREHALACYPASVFEKLSVLPNPGVVTELERAARGFSTQFLQSSVFLPKPLSPAIENDLLVVDNETVFHYTHFSLAMSRERKLARWVAWNIDGGAIRKVSRKGISFKKDRRLPRDAQHGNELYSRNPLDRGHIARRADLAWGSIAEAKRANEESFFFTNIAPQHEDFNQSSAGGIWGELENAIFENVDIQDLKVSILGGPIFKGNDPDYRGTKIPRSFWKAVYYHESGSSVLRAKAFVLTQDDLLTGLEGLELPEFAVFEVTINELQERTGLDVKNVRRSAPSSGIESLQKQSRVRKIESVRDIV